MPIERERKFLPDPDDPEVTALLSRTDRIDDRRIVQGYVIAAGDHGELRLRQVENGADRTRLLTVKTGRPPAREEVEVQITEAQWTALWPATAGRRIRKTRYLVPALGHTLEIDRFEEPEKGLVLIEIEFSDDRSAVSFVPPPWFGREVTDDPAYQNQNICLHK